MDNSTIWPDRQFQIWSYVVSHNQLLLRSPKSQRAITRVDILFKGVSFIHMETGFSGLSVQVLDEKAQKPLPNIPDILEDQKLFVLHTSSGLGYIVAAAYAAVEDDKEHYDASALISDGHL